MHKRAFAKGVVEVGAIDWGDERSAWEGDMLTFRWKRHVAAVLSLAAATGSVRAAVYHVTDLGPMYGPAAINGQGDVAGAVWSADGVTSVATLIVRGNSIAL